VGVHAERDGQRMLGGVQPSGDGAGWGVVVVVVHPMLPVDVLA
jgi:hypothetical protein